ncbi:hypothetical protein [Azospirillum griseum]|uniref:hypothetical protein n=1 Tax=Azospirillum griseum TaxID=2496639 RepID=UPI00157532A5|nr:hypothetical protein [Azospirillum griseum]
MTLNQWANIAWLLETKSFGQAQIQNARFFAVRGAQVCRRQRRAYGIVILSLGHWGMSFVRGQAGPGASNTRFGRMVLW